MKRLLDSVALLGFAVLSACAEGGGPDAVDLRLVDVLQVEDLRPIGEGRAPLLAGLADPSPIVRAAAVRALGRLEDVELLPQITPLFTDAAPSVRVEAFNAIAQTAYGAFHPEANALLYRSAGEVDGSEDPRVRAALARSLGRLWLADTEDPVSRARLVMALAPDENAAAVEGVLLGLYYLSLRSDEAVLESQEVISWIESHADHDEGRVRALAAATLAVLGDSSPDVVGRLLKDADAQVRLAAVGLLGSVVAGQEDDAPADESLWGEALADENYSVRAQVLRVLERSDRDRTCRHAQQALSDQSNHVRLVALQRLGSRCDDAAVLARLRELASGIGSAESSDWHTATQALVSLATVAPQSAADLVGEFAAHGNPFVRAYAARAAGGTGDEAVLRSLAQDDSPNVRTVAVGMLYGMLAHAMDEVLIQQLSTSDPQLLFISAQLLSGSNMGPALLEPALDALDRLSAGLRDTFRDPRMELLNRIGEFGSIEYVVRLEPYLSDYDPAVAGLAARLISEWSGSEVAADPRPNALYPFPTAEEFVSLRSTRVVLEMERGGSVVILLLPDEAPSNAARFVRLAEGGHFAGLTFHRVITNFIIQGGSPAANEYFGDGPFTRDEIGMRSHRRGTVGLSTRGRDTGDGQIFINTVDNLRLDHNYTIFGVVEEGMAVVDAVREGDVIRRARVERR